MSRSRGGTLVALVWAAIMLMGLVVGTQAAGRPEQGAPTVKATPTLAGPPTKSKSGIIISNALSSILMTRIEEDSDLMFSIEIGVSGIRYSGTGSDSLTWGPSALSVAPDGNIWIADTVANRLLVYSPEGTRISALDLEPYQVVGVGDIEVTLL